MESVEGDGRKRGAVDGGDRWIVDRAGFDALLQGLRNRGFTLVGPTVREQAIVYDEIYTSRDLPEGWTDRQEPGSYRLERRNDRALFGYVVGPHSWKKYFFPPVERLFQLTRNGQHIEEGVDATRPRRLALVGVRACEVEAIAVQDRVFLGAPYSDRHYRSRREGTFVVAVNCGQAGGACFCVSMNTGPKVTRGFDLSLTEILEGGRHEFVVEVGSASGRNLLNDVAHVRADERQTRIAEEIVNRTSRQMGRSLDVTEIQALLRRNYEHPRWDEVATRCLACANCTLVCPTCFCF